MFNSSINHLALETALLNTLILFVFKVYTLRPVMNLAPHQNSMCDLAGNDEACLESSGGEAAFPTPEWVHRYTAVVWRALQSMAFSNQPCSQACLTSIRDWGWGISQIPPWKPPEGGFGQGSFLRLTQYLSKPTLPATVLLAVGLIKSQESDILGSSASRQFPCLCCIMCH